jgi:hypothetical protein
MREDADGPPRIELLDPELVVILASKTGPERLAMAAGMFRSARRMIEAHLRSQNPDWDAEILEREVARRLRNGQVVRL